MPDAPGDRAGWCDYPHEVRAFLDRRGECDHFRGEPWPEGNSATERRRREALSAAMAAACAGTDARLRALRVKYRGDRDVAAALAALDDGIEP